MECGIPQSALDLFSLGKSAPPHSQVTSTFLLFRLVQEIQLVRTYVGLALEKELYISQSRKPGQGGFLNYRIQ